MVTDLNNSPPVFTGTKSYATTIPEKMPIGASVLDLAAADADLGVNAELTYSVVGTTGDAAYFYVDSLFPAGTGVVEIKQVTINFDYHREATGLLLLALIARYFPASCLGTLE